MPPNWLVESTGSNSTNLSSTTHSPYAYRSLSETANIMSKRDGDNSSSPNLSELFTSGLANRRAVVGDAFVQQALTNGSTEFSFPG